MDGSRQAANLDGFVYIHDKLPEDIRRIVARVRERHNDDAFDAALRAGLDYLERAGDYHGPLRLYDGDSVRRMANQRVRLRAETLERLTAISGATGLARRKITILAIHYARTCKMGSVIALEFPYRSARSR